MKKNKRLMHKVATVALCALVATLCMFQATAMAMTSDQYTNARFVQIANSTQFVNSGAVTGQVENEVVLTVSDGTKTERIVLELGNYGAPSLNINTIYISSIPNGNYVVQGTQYFPVSKWNNGERVQVSIAINSANGQEYYVYTYAGMFNVVGGTGEITADDLDNAYNNGYEAGREQGEEIYQGLLGVSDGMFNFIYKMLDFEFMGVNLAGLVFSVLSLLIVAIIIKFGVKLI